MERMVTMSFVKNAAVFVGGVVFGSLGFKLLGSKEARKVYVHTAAAAIRAKDSVMTDVTKVREGCGDIVADAKQLNEQKRAAQEAKCEVIEDDSEAEK
jgi:hypothetical protein